MCTHSHCTLALVISSTDCAAPALSLLLQGKKAPTIISILPVPQHVPEGGNTGPSRSISLSTDVYQGPLKYPYMWVCSPGGTAARCLCQQ